MHVFDYVWWGYYTQFFLVDFDDYYLKLLKWELHFQIFYLIKQQQKQNDCQNMVNKM